MSIPPNGRRVKPPRRYDSTRRRAQAAQTHLDILKAAQQLFLEGGYASTTINSVAAAAGVAGAEPRTGIFGNRAQSQRAGPPSSWLRRLPRAAPALPQATVG